MHALDGAYKRMELMKKACCPHNVHASCGEHNGKLAEAAVWTKLERRVVATGIVSNEVR